MQEAAAEVLDLASKFKGLGQAEAENLALKFRRLMKAAPEKEIPTALAAMMKDGRGCLATSLCAGPEP